TFVAVNLVAVCTRIVQFLADVAEGLVISRSRGLMRELSDLHQRRNVLLPIGTINGDGPAVLTPASWREEERRGLGDCDRSLIDGQPPGIHRGSPLDVIKRCGGRRFLRLSSGILDLKVEYGIRSLKRDGSHELGQVSFRRWKRRGSVPSRRR